MTRRRKVLQTDTYNHEVVCVNSLRYAVGHFLTLSPTTLVKKWNQVSAAAVDLCHRWDFNETLSPSKSHSHRHWRSDKAPWWCCSKLSCFIYCKSSLNEKKSFLPLSSCFLRFAHASASFKVILLWNFNELHFIADCWLVYDYRIWGISHGLEAKWHPVAAVKSSVELWCVERSERSKISMEGKGNEIIKVWKWTCAIFHIIIISLLVRWRRRRLVRAYRDFSFLSSSSSFLIASNNNLWLDVNFNMNWLWLTFPLYLDPKDHFRLVYLAFFLFASFRRPNIISSIEYDTILDFLSPLDKHQIGISFRSTIIRRCSIKYGLFLSTHKHFSPQQRTYL